MYQADINPVGDFLHAIAKLKIIHRHFQQHLWIIGLPVGLGYWTLTFLQMHSLGVMADVVSQIALFRPG